MPKITDASATQILLAEEQDYGKLPNPFSGIEFGITGEGLSPNIATVESEELNLNPDLIDNILSSVDAGGDLNFEACEGVGMRKILEHALRGNFVPMGTPQINTLKSGSANKSMSILKRFSSEAGEFPFAYTGARLNSLNFDITADGGIITSTANFMCRSEHFQGNFAMFHTPHGAPTNSLGNIGDIAVSNSDGRVYYKDDVKWNMIMNPWNPSQPFTLQVVEKTYASDGVPSQTSNTGIILWVRRTTGQFYISDGGVPNTFKAIENFVMLPEVEGRWRSGTSLPANELGSFGDYYFVLGDTDNSPSEHRGKVFQKMSREVDAPWVQVGILFNNTFDPTSYYYYGMTVAPKSLRTKMHIPQFKNIVITGEGASGKYCFTDLGFTIENNCENIKGLCTLNTEYPWLSSVETKYGNRVISGNATLLFNSVELYEDFFKKNKTLSLSFSMENGEDFGWKITFPKIKFTEGSINAEGRGENIPIPLRWVALYDDVLGCACMVEEIANETKVLPLTAPVAYGVTQRTHEGFRADWSYVENGLGYEVEVSDDAFFDNLVDTVVVPDNTVMSHEFSGLDAETKYYIRVRAYRLNDEVSAWSNVITGNTRIQAPTPIVGATAENFNFVWNDIDGAVGYLLDVSTDPNFETFHTDKITLEEYNQLEVESPKLVTFAIPPTYPIPTWYYWRLRAVAQNEINDSLVSSGKVMPLTP